MATKYFCDRCNKEVIKTENALTTIRCNPGHSYYKFVHAELCRPCIDELLGWLSSPPPRAAPADAEPRASRL